MPSKSRLKAMNSEYTELEQLKRGEWKHRKPMAAPEVEQCLCRIGVVNFSCAYIEKEPENDEL